jgi:transcriptional regulator with XRE-family HTH domain
MMSDMEDEALALGERLRAIREAAHMTQYQLGKRSGVSASWINKLESGVGTRPGQAVIDKLARALAVPSDALTGNAPLQIEPASSTERDEDPDVTKALVNFKRLKDLDEDGWEAVDKVIRSMLKEAEEHLRAERKSRKPKPGGLVDRKDEPSQK